MADDPIVRKSDLDALREELAPQFNKLQTKSLKDLASGPAGAVQILPQHVNISMLDPDYGASGWSSYPDVNYAAKIYKDPFGIVGMSGLVIGPAVVASATTTPIFTLPYGWAPARGEYFSMPYVGSAVNRFDAILHVLGTTVYFYQYSGGALNMTYGAGYVPLSPVRFRAGI